MDKKGSQPTSSTNLADTPPKNGVVYIAVKGSLNAVYCTVYGLGNDEILALNAKFPGTVTKNYSGMDMKVNTLQILNALAQLGYNIISTTGEDILTWTMQREI